MGAKRFVCAACGKAYDRPAKLRTHLRTHTGERPFECGQCLKQFGRKSALTAHARVHTGERPFGCVVCDKRFATNQHLKAHEATHKERFCCGRGFASELKLVRHVNKYHRATYHCAVCGFGGGYALFTGHVCHDGRGPGPPEGPEGPEGQPEGPPEGEPAQPAGEPPQPAGEPPQPAGEPQPKPQPKQTPKTPTKNPTKNPKTPTINRLTGAGYKERPLGCPHCKYRFNREYDRSRHLRARHPAVAQGPGSAGAGPECR